MNVFFCSNYRTIFESTVLLWRYCKRKWSPSYLNAKNRYFGGWQIDYCNSLMDGLPENLIMKLQRVQNTAARLVFNLRKYDRITPALVTLHWLPVKYRIEFKTLLIVFKGLHVKAPTYIEEMNTSSKSKIYSIRSNEERVLKVPQFKHDTFGKHAFAVYGPLAWNCLPKEIGYVKKLKHSSET